MAKVPLVSDTYRRASTYARRVVRGLRRRLRGLRQPPASPTPAPAFGLTVGPPLKRTPKLPEDTAWTPFPEIEGFGALVTSQYETGPRPARFDVELLEALNAEYASKPLVPAPRSAMPKPMQTAARGRVAKAHSDVDLRDATVLEIGCGRGYEVFMVGNDYGSRAHGIDVRSYETWPLLAGDNVSFTLGDMAVENPFEPNTFDRIVSYTVWEHVLHPRKMLEETYAVLKPGGLAWIHANLYAGPKASHRYRQIYFPWPHLLFSDDVISEWDAKHGRETRGSSWVNQLSWSQYERYLGEIGFRLRKLSFNESAWDEEFYRRFEDVLGRIPIRDLKRDFFTAVIEKPL
jgi:SAM-dependent methyltransferase